MRDVRGLLPARVRAVGVPDVGDGDEKEKEEEEKDAGWEFEGGAVNMRVNMRVCLVHAARCPGGMAEKTRAPFCRFCTVLEGQISGKRTPTREPGRPEWVCSGPGVPWYHAYRLVWPLSAVHGPSCRLAASGLHPP